MAFLPRQCKTTALQAFSGAPSSRGSLIFMQWPWAPRTALQIPPGRSFPFQAGQVVLEGHIKHCVRDGIEHGDADKTIESFTKAVERFANTVRFGVTVLQQVCQLIVLAVVYSDLDAAGVVIGFLLGP